MNQFFNTIPEITAWLDARGVENYTLKEDLAFGYVVDVQGSVNFWAKDLDFIFVKFNHVTGNFSCNDNELTSLIGCPQSVGGNFYCNRNQLTSLEGGPKIIHGAFSCRCNQLISLEHGPEVVGQLYDCRDNGLISLKGAPKTLNGGNGSFLCSNNHLNSLMYAPTYVNGFFDCQKNKLTSLQYGPETVQNGFYCSHNAIETLEYCPQIVGKSFNCSGNPSLGDVQTITDFQKIYQMHLDLLAIKKEKNALEQSVFSPKIGSKNESL